MSDFDNRSKKYIELINSAISEYVSEKSFGGRESSGLELMLKAMAYSLENGGKRIFPEAIQKNDKIKVAVSMDGTINNSKDNDKYFVVEMAIPMSIINSKGDIFKPGTQWNILCARYNYSKSLFDLELTSTSANMPKANWHDRKSYLPVVFR